MASKNGPYTSDAIPFSGNKTRYVVVDKDGHEVTDFNNRREDTIYYETQAEADAVASELSGSDDAYLSRRKAHYSDPTVSYSGDFYTTLTFLRQALTLLQTSGVSNANVTQATAILDGIITANS